MNFYVSTKVSRNLKSVCLLLLFNWVTQVLAIDKPVIKNNTVKSEVEFMEMVKFFEDIRPYHEKNEYIEGEQQTLLNYANKGYKWAMIGGTEQQILISKFFRVRFLVDLEAYEEALPLAYELISNKQFQKDTMVILLAGFIKKIYLNTYAYDQLLKFYPIYSQLNKSHGVIVDKSDYINDSYLAYAFYNQKNYPNAIKYFKKHLSTLKIENQYINFASTFNDIGLCFRNMEEWDSANFYYDKALVWLKSRFDQDKGLIYFYQIVASNRADYYVEIGQANKALPFYKRELEASRRKNDNPIILSAYYNLATVAYFNKNLSYTLLMIDSGMAIATRSLDYLIKLYHLKAMCLAGIGDLKTATQYFKIENNIRDSMVLNRIKNNYIISSIQFEVARTENDLMLSQAHAREAENTSYFRLIGLLVLGVLALVIFLFYRKANKDKQIIENQKVKAEKDAHDKSVLLKEIHHRVKNNLQVISGLLDLQIGKMQSEEYNQVVEEIQKHIHSMSLVHQMLYQNSDVSEINIVEYIEQLVSHVYSGQIKKNVSFNLEVQNFNISLDKAIPLGLIITELITNSFKHGFDKSEDGRISINLIEEAQQIIFNYFDNGIGISEPIDIENTKSLGFRLVNMLAEEMNAQLKINMTNYFSLTLIFKDE